MEYLQVMLVFFSDEKSGDWSVMSKILRRHYSKFHTICASSADVGVKDHDFYNIFETEVPCRKHEITELMQCVHIYEY
jgi:hypothetical protein